MGILRKLRQAIHTLGVSEKGAATVEFVIVFPFWVGCFVSAYEVASMNMRAVMLERATDVVVRDIRLGGGQVLVYEDIRREVCENALMIPDCLNATKVELSAIDTSNWTGALPDADCVDRGEQLNPPLNFQNGQQNELMLIRVCSLVEPFFPTFGVGRSIPRAEETGENGEVVREAYMIIASSAFVNEPDG